MTRETRKERYQRYLQSHGWREKRLAALKRADYTCAWCGSYDHLQVHHPSYHNLGREGARHLIVLCDRCHSKVHRRPQSATNRRSQPR